MSAVQFDQNAREYGSGSTEGPNPQGPRERARSDNDQSSASSEAKRIRSPDVIISSSDEEETAPDPDADSNTPLALKSRRAPPVATMWRRRRLNGRTLITSEIAADSIGSSSRWTPKEFKWGNIVQVGSVAPHQGDENMEMDYVSFGGWG